jgi:hypothetical protein
MKINRWMVGLTKTGFLPFYPLFIILSWFFASSPALVGRAQLVCCSQICAFCFLLHPMAEILWSFVRLRIWCVFCLWANDVYWSWEFGDLSLISTVFSWCRRLHTGLFSNEWVFGFSLKLTFHFREQSQTTITNILRIHKIINRIGSFRQTSIFYYTNLSSIFYRSSGHQRKILVHGQRSRTWTQHIQLWL